MRRGTTPTYVIRVLDRDMSDIQRVILSFEQTDEDGNIAQELDVECNIASDGAFATLTREQTLAFSKGSVKVQVTTLTNDGVWKTNDIEKEKVIDTIYE